MNNVSDAANTENSGGGRSRKKTLGAMALLLLLVAGYVFYQWYRVHDVQMSERPERSAAVARMEPTDSTIVASITVSHATLKAVLTAMGQKLAGTKNDSEELKCISSDFPRIKECLTANWNATYVPGSIGVAKDGEFVKVTVPVSFTGQAGFGGGIAEALSLNAKNIVGEAVASVSFGAQLDERFCPVLTVQRTEFAWVREASVDVIGRTNVFRIFDIGPITLNVGRHFNGPIREALETVAKDANKAIPCDPFRAEIAKVWQRYSVPIVSEGQPTVYLNASPSSAGSSGLLSEEGGLRVVLMLSGKAAVETSPGPGTPLGELPAHVKLAPQAGQLNLAVPARVEYAKIEEALKSAVAGKTFEQETPAGKVVVKLSDFEVFPSGKHISVGVKFDVDAPTGLFDTRGTAWLLAVPVVGADGKTVALSDVKIHRKIDNEAVKVLTAIFEGQIKKAIEDGARYNLKKDEQSLIVALQKAISDPTKTGGVKLTVTEPNIQFGRVAIEDKALTVEGLFKAGWNAEVQELKL